MKKQLLTLIGFALALGMNAQTQLYVPDSTLTSGTTAQDFEAAFDQYDGQGAEDFTVPNGETWLIDSFIIMGQYSATAASLTSGINIEIFTDNNGLPGTSVFQQTTNTDVDKNADGDLTAFFDPPLSLSAGHYWVVVNARKDFATGGQWYWSRDFGSLGDTALWRNPNDGFVTGCTSWIQITDCAALGVTTPGLSFYIWGCNNPPRPSLSFNSGDTAICAGQSLTLTATTDANPPQYAWSNGDSTQSITIIQSGTYTVTVSDGVGTCQSRKSVNINVVNVSQPNVGSDDSICAGGQPALFVTLQPNCANCVTIWPDGSHAGYYYASTEGWVVLTFMDTVSGCFKSDSAYLTVHSNKATILPDSLIEFCAGSSVTLRTVEALTNVVWQRSSNGITWVPLSLADTAIASQAGFVAVSGTTEFNCAASDTSYMNQHPMPNPDIILETLTDGTVKLSLTGLETGYTFKWNNGKTTAGIIATVNGTYIVTVTNTWGCEAVRSVTVSTVGVSEASSTVFEIFPNPAKDVVHITLPQGSQAPITVTDVSGRTVATSRPTRNQHTVDLDIAHLPNGTYFIHMKDTPTAHGSFVVVR